MSIFSSNKKTAEELLSTEILKFDEQKEAFKNVIEVAEMETSVVNYKQQKTNEALELATLKYQTESEVNDRKLNSLSKASDKASLMIANINKFLGVTDGKENS